MAAPAPSEGPVPAKAAQPKPSAKKAPAKPPVSVEMTIVAASPDPPWTLRIVNAGDHAVRIAADTRLLTFELDTGDKHGAKVKCAAPTSLRPRAFPATRELYLDPGESFVETFDPRLFCFGSKIDLLHGGTTVRARLGWSKSSASKGPFAAQGTDRPEAFAPVGELSAPPILLSYAAFAPMALGVGQAVPGEKPVTDGDAVRDDDRDDDDSPGDRNGKPSWTERKERREARAESKPGDYEAKKGFGYQGDKQPAKDAKADKADDDADDRNAGRMDVYIDRYADAEAPRDAVVNIRAVNEGRRDLAAALRGRMLSFTVEQLGPDNKARRSFDCRGADRPHAMPIETIRDVDAGQTVAIPIVLAEICPRETFERPGLYRVRPRLDTTVEGEVLERHPYVGRALARQSALVRIASSRKPFQDEAPKPYAAPASTSATADASTPAQSR